MEEVGYLYYYPAGNRPPALTLSMGQVAGFLSFRFRVRYWVKKLGCVGFFVLDYECGFKL